MPELKASDFEKLPIYIGVGADFVKVAVGGVMDVVAMLRAKGIEVDEAAIARIEAGYNAAIAHEKQILAAKPPTELPEGGN